MANEGPTTVGSIDAKVGMDLDQWKADVAYLKASAEQIGALHPDITVDAHTASAEAAMAQVDAELKHGKTIFHNFFSELGIYFSFFFCFCRKVKKYKYPHYSISI